MPAARLDFLIEQGTTFARVLRLSDGTIPTNLNGWLLRGQVRRKHADPAPAASLVFTVTDAATGSVTMSLSAEATALLSPRTHVYDVELVNGTTGTVVRLLEGEIEVAPEVTR